MDKVLKLFGLELTFASSVPSYFFFKIIKDKIYISTEDTDTWDEVSPEDASLFFNDKNTYLGPTIIARRSKIRRKSSIKMLM